MSSTATEYEAAFRRVLRDPRYLANIDWGVPRPGHPEGSIRAHIADLEKNLEALGDDISEEDRWKLKLLIHTHDTFKGVAEPGVPISHPRSHSSLARAFLAEFCDDAQLLRIVQDHDVPYALYRQFRRTHVLNRHRFERLLTEITEWDLFMAFLTIDGSTAGKSPEPLNWFRRQVKSRCGA